MKTITLLALILCFFVACTAPISKKVLREKPAYSVKFEVNKQYQRIFQSLLDQTRACYLHKPLKHQITVVGKRNNADKTANIVVEHVYAMANHDAYLMIDFKSLDEGRTEVEVYTSDSQANKEVDGIKSWATSSDTQCYASWLS